MDCLVCKITRPNERFILQGIDLKTNETVQFHLPRSIVLKIKEFSEKQQKLTLIKKICLWVMKLFGQLPKEKMLTITFNSKTYKVNFFEKIETNT